jgi:hypothetical protein
MSCSKEIILVDGKVKKITTRKDGYQVISINGKIKYLHRYLAELYIPNPDNKLQVNHINGIKNDNRIENLEWVTPKQNRNHAFDTKLWGKCILQSRKLTDKDVKDIKQKYQPKKYSQRKLATEYNVSRTTIADIINEKRYKKTKQQIL